MQVPGLDRDRHGPVTPSIGDFQVIARNQTVVSFGVAEEFEGEGRF